MSDQWVSDALRRGEDEAKLRRRRATVVFEVELEYEVECDDDEAVTLFDDIKRDVERAIKSGLTHESARVRRSIYDKTEIIGEEPEWEIEE